MARMRRSSEQTLEYRIEQAEGEDLTSYHSAFWAEIKNGFHSYKSKNRIMREKECENFGADDDKNFSTIVSKIKKDNTFIDKMVR